jgi:RNA polymerase sigma factor (sigma-70 family)
MAESPITRASLLVRLRDGQDDKAWCQFVGIYGPLVYQYGRRHGLQDADAADLAQEVLQVVSKSAGKFSYDPARGTFRGWLFTVARNKWHQLAARIGKQPRGSGDPATVDQLNELPDRGGDDDDDEREWTRAYEQRLLDWAMEQVRGEFRESTWQAFWRTAVERASPKNVASDLGLSVGAVYMARARVLARLREQVDEVRFDDVPV